MLAYTTFFIGVGGYLTAWIARRSRLTHAAIMDAIEVAFTPYVMTAAPFHEAHPAPRWVWITGVILMVQRHDSAPPSRPNMRRQRP
jgi:hypothetical protein